MTALPQSTRRKLSLLALAEELGNVSKACQIMGYHRDSFYEIKRAFQVGEGRVSVKRLTCTTNRCTGATEAHPTMRPRHTLLYRTNTPGQERLQAEDR